MATTTEVIRDTGTLPVTYDRYGRMNYHPDFHPNQRHPWTTTDQKYLIANYEKDGPEAVSFALGRTVHTVMTRACQLRKRGDMPKPAARIKHRRIKPR
ncbi:MAG: hypothetical protein Q8K65_06195 [Alphaproteobacteria bacterium]|nr:hypothetical protein [Alphaproteobacteria bacterium]